MADKPKKLRCAIYTRKSTEQAIAARFHIRSIPSLILPSGGR